MTCFEHYTAEPFTGPLARYPQREGDMKPRGLWISVPGEYGWPEWCHDNEYAPEKLACRSIVTLAPGANVLRIGTPDALLAFGERYCKPIHPSVPHVQYPDWGEVAASCDGVIISPYQWGHRLDVSWYYPWDCASGCIWEPNAVQSIVPADQKRIAHGNASEHQL